MKKALRILFLGLLIPNSPIFCAESSEKAPAWAQLGAAAAFAAISAAELAVFAYRHMQWNRYYEKSQVLLHDWAKNNQRELVQKGIENIAQASSESIKNLSISSNPEYIDVKKHMADLYDKDFDGIAFALGVGCLTIAGILVYTYFENRNSDQNDI